MNVDKGTWDRLLTLAHEAAAPESLRRTHRDAPDIDSDEFEVRPGQIWSAEWAEEVVCVLVLTAAIPSRWISVIPVLFEPEAREGTDIFLRPDQTSLGVPATVWPDLVWELPLKTLDRPLGSASSDILESVLTWEQNQRSGTAPTDSGQGSDNFISPSTRDRLRAEIQDSLETLKSAAQATDERVAASASGLIRQKSLSFKVVMQTLGVSQQQAMAIARGKHPLRPDEARLLADQSGHSLEEVQSVASPLPEEVLVELDQPRWRALVRDEARRQYLDDDAARLSLGYEAFGLAARQKGSGPDVWRQRLRTIARGRQELGREGG